MRRCSVVSGRNPGRRLFRQFQVELVQEELVIRVRLGMARQDQPPTIGGRQMNIDHLEGGKLLQDRPRGQPRCTGAGQVLARDLQAVGDDGDENMCFDPVLALMEDRTNGEVLLELSE